MSIEERVEYSDNQDFNDAFDSYTPEIKIGNLTPYKASYVLYYTDYRAYMLAIEEYRRKVEEDIIDTIYSDYPQPIAYYFHQSEYGYSNNNHRLQLLRSTWEAIIFTLYAIVTGEARNKKVPLKNIAVPKADGSPDISFNDYFSDRLAQKLLIIERILSYGIDNNIPLISNDIISIPIVQRIRGLNQERNEFMHTAAISEDQASQRYTELYPEVLEVLANLKELGSLDLLHYVENVGSVTSLRCEIFKGFSLVRIMPTIQINAATLTTIANELNNQNILARYRNNIFSVTPFFHFSKEANGNRTNLCYCKRKHSNTRFEFEIVTRSEPYETDGSMFTDRVSELRGLTI